MNKIQYRMDLDFIASIIHFYSPRDLEMDSPMVDQFEDGESLWTQNEKDLSFSNRNMMRSIGASSGFMDFLNYGVYTHGILWLTSLEEGSFLDALKEKYLCEVTCGKDQVYEMVRTTLDDYYRSTSSDYTIFYECIFKPEGIIEGLRNAFSQAYEIFQNKFYTSNVEKIESQLDAINDKLEEDSIGYLKRIILAGFERFEHKLESLEIYLIYAAPYWFGASFNPDFITVSYSMTLKFENNQPSEEIVEFIKLISDPKRYEMLKHLSQKPAYGAELAKALDLSTATVSHHLSKMTLLKLIDAEKAEKNRIYFKINSKNFEAYLDLIKRDILS